MPRTPQEILVPPKIQIYPDDIKFMIFNLNDEEVTQEHINEAIIIGESEGRI
jgi:hypothetical protein